MQIKSRLIISAVSIVLYTLCFVNAIAQVTDYDENRRGSMYIGLGGGTASYTSSTIKVTQASLGNDYSISNFSVGNTGSGKGKSFPFSTSFQIGYYCNYNQTFGIELSYDPAKYFVHSGQYVTISGYIDNAKYNNNKVLFATTNGFQYYMNGTGLMLINAVRRIPVYRGLNHLWAFDVIPKIGVGPLMAYPQTELYGATEKAGNQFCGYNLGFELAAKVTCYRYFYCEIGYRYDKVDVTSLKIASGTATQDFNAKEILITLGFTFPITKHNPLYFTGEKKKRVPRGPQPMYHGDSKTWY